MADYKNEEAGLFVTDGPDDLSPEEKKNILLALRSTGEPFNGTHEEALERAMSAKISGSVIRGIAEPTSPEPVSIVDPESQLSIAEQLIQGAGAAPEPKPSIADQLIAGENAPAPGEQPKTDLRGLISAATLGMAPTSAAALIGAAVAGPPGAVVAALAVPASDLVVMGANAVFGTEWRTPSEAIRGALVEMGVVDMPETQLEQAIMMVTQALGNAGAASGTAQQLANMPGAVGTGPSQLASAPGGTNPAQFFQRGPGTIGSTGIAQPTLQTVPATAGREIAKAMAFGPGSQAAGAIVGGAGEEATARGLIELGVKPEWANLAGMLVGMIGDAVTSGVIDNVALKQRARGMDVPQEAQDMIDITEQMAPGRRPDGSSRELSTDEMLLGSHPTQKEFTDIATRMRSSGAGTTDAFSGRVQDTQGSLLRFAAEEGVETSSLGGIINNDPEMLFIYNNIRRQDVNRYATQKYDILDDLSPHVAAADSSSPSQAAEALRTPAKPVDVSNTQEVIKAVQDDLADLGTNEFDGMLKQLDDLNAAIETKNVSQINRHLAITRNRIGDEIVPQGPRKEIDAAYTKIAAALKDDMDSFILREGGEEAMDKFNEANVQLQRLLEDFNDKDLADLINEAARLQDRQTLRSVQNVHKSDMDPVAYKAFYEQLDDQGKDLSWSALVGNILEEAGPLEPGLRQWADTVTKYEPLIRVATENRPEALAYLEDMNKFIGDVAGQAERVVKEGVTSGRMGLGENPTAGIALSQGVRRFGIGFGYLIGDMMQGSYGAIARAYQRPKIRNMVASLRTLTPGTTAWDRMARNLFRDIMVNELEAEEAEDEEEEQ